MFAIALAVLASSAWQYEAPPARPQPAPPAHSAPSAAENPEEGADVPSAPPTWSDLVAPLADSGYLPPEALASGLLPKVEAFLDANPGERAANLARATEALGFNAALLSGRVVAELRREPQGTADALGLRALGRAAGSNLGLALAVLADVRSAGRTDAPGHEAFSRVLLDPPFPVDQDPPACRAGELLEAVLPTWGESEAADARLTAVLASCPGADTSALERGLADGRGSVRSAALLAWGDAVRSGRAMLVEQPERVADAIVAMLGEHGLPPREGGTRGRSPAEAVAAVLVPVEMAEHGLAALGNGGHMDDMRELTRAVDAARTPNGTARSLRDLTR